MTAAVQLKPSAFNVKLRHEGRHLAFNSIVAHSLEMSEAQARVFNDALDEVAQSGSCKDEALLRCLYALGFVVPADHDELAVQRAVFQATKASTETLRFTIAPTMACNLHCSYCFQQDFAPCKTMRLDIERGIIEFARRKLEGCKTLVVQWFGGEPLLRYKRIVAMTEAFQRVCAERGVNYYAEILTNGVLLTPEIIANLPKLAVKAIQIPLDGDVDTYARRKGVSRERAQAYHDVLVNHMHALVDATGSVTIRINVDRENPAAGYDVVRMFKRKGCVDPRIDFPARLSQQPRWYCRLYSARLLIGCRILRYGGGVPSLPGRAGLPRLWRARAAQISMLGTVTKQLHHRSHWTHRQMRAGNWYRRIRVQLHLSRRHRAHHAGDEHIECALFGFRPLWECLPQL
ncbi:radical SAM protein [Bradyrhizobium elkanii]|nr:radical SAM protein [Bradyrhizobium elkanii]